MTELHRQSWSREVMAVDHSRYQEPEVRDIMMEEVVWFEDLTG